MNKINKWDNLNWFLLVFFNLFMMVYIMIVEIDFNLIFINLGGFMLGVIGFILTNTVNRKK